MRTAKKGYCQRADMLPPVSSRNKDKQIFCQRYVKMRGENYYLRVFSDGWSEFARYDETAKKWVHLHFPPESRSAC